MTDAGVETAAIALLNEEADCETKMDSITELSDQEAEYYQILRKGE